ncbi:MAG: hypothetical protein ACTHJ3_07785 [Pararhizobium sp.]
MTGTIILIGGCVVAAVIMVAIIRWPIGHDGMHRGGEFDGHAHDYR